MTNLAALDIILIFAYFAILIAIGYWSSRRQSEEDYLIAKRKLGTWSTMFTINASKTGGILMAYVALVYLYGFSAVWMFIGYTIGFLVFIPFAMKLKENSRGRFYTMADYFKHNYGKKAGVAASLFSILLMYGYLMFNILAGAKIFTYFTGWPFWICGILMSTVVLIYLSLGGFKAVVKTDILQYAAILFIMVLLTSVLFKGSLIPQTDLNLFSAGWVLVVGFFVVGIAFAFGMPDLWRRVYAARGKKEVKRGILLSAIAYMFVAALLTLVALTVKASYPTVDPDFALIHGFSMLLPNGLLGLAVVLLFAAIMSSTDTYLFTSSTAIIQDFFSWSKQKIVRNVKKTIFILAVTATAIAIAIEDMIIGGYIILAFVIALATVVMATWVRKRISQRAVVYGLTTGALGLAIFIAITLFLGNVEEIILIFAIVAALAGMLAGGLVSLLKK